MMFDHINLQKVVFEVGKLYSVDVSKTKTIVARMLADGYSTDIEFDIKNRKTSYHFWLCCLRALGREETATRQSWEIHGLTYEYQDSCSLAFDFNSYLYLGRSSVARRFDIERHIFLCEDKYIIFNLPGTAPYVLSPLCENS